MSQKMDTSETTPSHTKLEPFKYYTTLLERDWKIKYLTLRMMEVMGDQSMVHLCRILSTYLIKYAKLSCDDAVACIEAPGGKEIIYQFFESESSYFSPDTIVIGVDLNCAYMANSIQKALDVKAIGVGVVISNRKRVIPEITQNIVYSHKDLIWIRIIVPLDFDCGKLNKLSFSPDVVIIDENIYELYVEKHKKLYHPFDMINELDRLGLEVVFCSEGSEFREYPQLFISNYIKFMFCYELSRNIFSIESVRDLFNVNLYILYSLLFLKTKNFTVLPDTFSQFAKMVAERPKSQISTNHFLLTGPKDGIFLDKPSFHGGRGLNTTLSAEIMLNFNDLHKQIKRL